MNANLRAFFIWLGVFALGVVGIVAFIYLLAFLDRMPI